MTREDSFLVASRCVECGAARKVRWVPMGLAVTARLECPRCKLVVAI